MNDHTQNLQNTHSEKKKKGLNSADAILKKYDFAERFAKQSKHLKMEFQDFGIRISHKLNDKSHKALYINLAKNLPRSVLEDALQFTLDYPTKDLNKGKLFMWKLSEICKAKGIKMPRAGKIRKKKNTQLKFRWN